MLAQEEGAGGADQAFAGEGAPEVTTGCRGGGSVPRLVDSVRLRAEALQLWRVVGTKPADDEAAGQCVARSCPQREYHPLPDRYPVEGRSEQRREAFLCLDEALDV